MDKKAKKKNVRQVLLYNSVFKNFFSIRVISILLCSLLCKADKQGVVLVEAGN